MHKIKEIIKDIFKDNYPELVFSAMIGTLFSLTGVKALSWLWWGMIFTGWMYGFLKQKQSFEKASEILKKIIEDIKKELNQNGSGAKSK